MLRKIILSSALLMSSLSLQATTQAAAVTSTMEAGLPTFPVAVNGHYLDVTHSSYPLLVYKDITYFPMTWNYTAALGLSVTWDSTQGLSIDKKNSCEPLQQDITPKVNASDAPHMAAPVPFPVKVGGNTIRNADEPYPILFYRDITYFPMTWRFTHDEFDWTTSWDAQRGYAINACGNEVRDNSSEQLHALNASNGGQLAAHGSIVYMTPNNSYRGPSKLVKLDQSTGTETKLSDDDARSINLAGDWLYYSAWSSGDSKQTGIYRMKTDGTERTRISLEPVNQLLVHDGYIYYVHQTFHIVVENNGYFKPDAIHRMKLDGSEDQVLYTGFSGGQIYIYKEKLYFIQSDEPGENNLYVMNLDGSELRKLQQQAGRMAIIDDWIYLIHHMGGELSKISLDGTVRIPLYRSEPDNPISAINYHDGWVYFVSGKFGIHGSATIRKMRVDGSQVTRVADAKTWSLYVAGSKLYVSLSYMGDNHLESIDIQ